MGLFHRSHENTSSSYPPSSASTATACSETYDTTQAPQLAIVTSNIGTAEGLLCRATEGAKSSPSSDEESGKEGREVGSEGKEVEETDEEWTYPEGGWQAYKVVLGCFIFSASIMGWGLTWGVWAQYLHVHTYPDVPLSILNLVAGLSNAMMNAVSFVAGRLGDKYGYKRMIAISAVAMWISLIISAFVYEHLVLMFIFQGFVLGCSGGLGMPLYMAFPAQYFKKRRGLATGIAVSGAGFGGAISSLIMRALLPRVGYRGAMLIYAGINGFGWVGAWFLMEQRTPPPGKKAMVVAKNWLPVGIWNDGAFYSLMSCIFIGIFGYLIPYFFLTTYTTLNCPELDPNSISPAVPLVLANFFSGCGRIFAGILADRFGPVNMLFLSFFLGGLFQITLWPYAHTYASINVFAALYGFSGSWFFSLLPVAAAQLFGLNGLATITGLAVLVNAPGQFLGGSIGGVVLTTTGSYTGVAYYAGGVMIVGSLCLLYGRFSREKRVFAKF